MGIAEPLRMKPRQGILTSRGGVFAVEPCLIPLLGVIVQLGVRVCDLFPFLNRHATQLRIRAISKLSTAF